MGRGATIVRQLAGRQAVRGRWLEAGGWREVGVQVAGGRWLEAGLAGGRWLEGWVAGMSGWRR